MTLLAFYLYAYSFFHGCMFALDDSFIQLFSTNDIINLLTRSGYSYLCFLVLATFTAGFLLGMPYFLYQHPIYATRDESKVIRDLRRVFWFLCFVAFSAPLFLLHLVQRGRLHAPSWTSPLSVAGNFAVIGWSEVAIVLIVFSDFNRGMFSKYARLLVISSSYLR